jgi:diguanylate cyclase (GGDEF)-like protein
MVEHGEHAGVAGLTLIHPDGRVAAATWLKPGERAPNVLDNPEWRADFEANLKQPGFSINRPQLGYSPRKLKIPLRHTLHDNAGRPSLVIQTSILLEAQQGLWRNLPTEPSISIGLLREDGYLISRLPDTGPVDIYRKQNLRGALYLATRANPDHGHYDGTTADGLVRYGAYQKLSHYPLYAFMSLPRSTVLATWWQSISLPLYLIAAVFIAGVLVFEWNARRYAVRMGTIRARLADSSGDLPGSGVHEIDTLVGALHDTQQRLREAMRNRERQLLAAAHAGTYTVRVRDDTVTAADAAFLGMLGREAGEVIGKPWSALLTERHPATAQMELETAELSLHVAQLARSDGNPLWLSLAEYEETVDGERVRQGLAFDVSERERLLATVRGQTARLQALWQAATHRFGSEEERIAHMLRLARETLGMDAVLISERIGDDIVIRYAVADHPMFGVGARFPLRDSLCHETLKNGRTRLIPDLPADPAVREQPIAQAGFRRFASTPLMAGEQLYGTLVFAGRRAWPKDIDEDEKLFMELLSQWFGQMLWQHRQRAVLEEMALTDSLTGLPNRRAAEARLQTEAARARRDGAPFAVAIGDLDRFKLINDHYGHDVGDEVLTAVTGIMRAGMREGDWIARWGGEEFLVLLHSASGEEALAAAERLRHAIRHKPLNTREGPLEVTASIGIGVWRGPQQDVADVLSEADGCLYEAKRRGRDCVVMNPDARHGTLWKAGMLQHALREGRLTAAYQNIVDLDSGRVVADEALARLRQPDGTVLAAADFIEAAEGLNLIHLVDGTVARLAMARCRTLAGNGKARPGLTHFVNLSPQFLSRRELVESLLADARELCECHGMDFGATRPIVLEITERQLLADLRQLERDLRPLLDFGFRLALDDFGSGYSSFLYLSELPVSFLKIEGWMVKNLKANARVSDIVQSTIDLARRLGITTIAECVEDLETADRLRAMGVDWAQGHYFGWPSLELAAPDHASDLRPAVN